MTQIIDHGGRGIGTLLLIQKFPTQMPTGNRKTKEKSESGQREKRLAKAVINHGCRVCLERPAGLPLPPMVVVWERKRELPGDGRNPNFHMRWPAIQMIVQFSVQTKCLWQAIWFCEVLRFLTPAGILSPRLGQKILQNIQRKYFNSDFTCILFYPSFCFIACLLHAAYTQSIIYFKIIIKMQAQNYLTHKTQSSNFKGHSTRSHEF